MSQVRILACAEAQEGKAEELKQVLLQLVEPTRKEKGNLFYEFYASNQPGVFYFNEHWASAEDLKAHSTTARFQEVIGQAQKLTKTPMQVSVLSQIA